MSDDQQITRSEFDVLKAEVATNTEFTKEVLAILKGFKLLGLIAKWVAAVVGAVIAVKTGWHTFTGK